MVALDTLKPHLTHDFLVAFRALGKQVGYRNLGRAIAYTELPSDNGSEPEQSIPDNDDGYKLESGKILVERGSLAPWERPTKGHLTVRSFTPCANHAEEARTLLAAGLWDAYRVGRLLQCCESCREWSRRYARIVAEEMVKRNGQRPHYQGRWRYQGDCTNRKHDGFYGKRRNCPECNKEALAAWVVAAGKK